MNIHVRNTTLNPYQPTAPADFVYGNTESLERIEDIVLGDEPIPSAFGKCGIILYGVYGTGKTTLAKLLPALIELGKTNEELAMEAEFLACKQGLTGPQLMSKLDAWMSTRSLNASGLHYFILDEVDMLHKLTQESLKSVLNTKRAVFVLTTNNLAKLDKGLRDRCVLIEMNAANDSEYLPLARRRCKDMNVVLSDEQLLTAIALGRGSIRTVMEQVELTARRHLKKLRMAANSPQNSIAA